MQCQIAPSTIHRGLLVGIASGAVLAIAISMLPLPLQMLAALGVISYFAYQFNALSLPVSLTHQGGPDNSANCWKVRLGNHKPFDATLIAKGYRSSVLLVLAFQADSDKRMHFIPVWCDSVKPSQYSYLNLQLLFNTTNKESVDSR